jgi:hypothetical protein
MNASQWNADRRAEREIQEYNAEKRGVVPSGWKARRPAAFEMYTCQKTYTK